MTAALFVLAAALIIAASTFAQVRAYNRDRANRDEFVAALEADRADRAGFIAELDRVQAGS